MVITPKTYQKLYQDHRALLNHLRDPTISHVIKLRKLLPEIMKSKKLSEREKMERYVHLRKKIHSITQKQLQKETNTVEKPIHRQPTPEPIEVDTIEAVEPEQELEEEDFSEYFSPKYRAKALQIIHALKNSPRITMIPGENKIHVLGQNTAGTNIVDVVHKLVTPEAPNAKQKGFPPGTHRILMELATNTNLGAHSINNTIAREQFMNYRNPTEPTEFKLPKSWIKSPNLYKTKSGRVVKPVKMFQ